VTPVELLQQLIRFDTTNPPGDEAECVAFVRGLLEEAGCEVELYAKDPARPNLVSRLPGSGSRAPLLLQGHVDVVTTSGQEWARPPFGGELVDGYVWGRGALDMKGGVAMMVSAFLRAAREQTALPGDVILWRTAATTERSSSSRSTRTCSKTCSTRWGSSAASRWSWAASACTRSRSPRSRSAG
jgi:acetylornithine deacetylase/succinyl-diaminopimelate desuccinylase-like protein